MAQMDEFSCDELYWIPHIAGESGRCVFELPTGMRPHSPQGEVHASSWGGRNTHFGNPSSARGTRAENHLKLGWLRFGSASPRHTRE
jgi:hypothetical protein